MQVKIQVGSEEFRLLGPNGEESSLATHGEMVLLETAGGMYGAVWDGESAQAYRLEPVACTVEDDVEFDIEDDGECSDDDDDYGDEEDEL